MQDVIDPTQTLKDLLPKSLTAEPSEMIYLSKSKLLYMQMIPFSEHIEDVIELSMTNGDALTSLSRATVKMLIGLITNFIPVPLFSNS